MGTRSWWGWGDEDRHLGGEALEGLATLVADRLGSEVPRPAAVRDPSSLAAAPTLAVPDALADLFSVDPVDRVRHSRGNAYRDVVRALHGELPAHVAAVARPRTEDDVLRLLDWAGEAGVACVPFGGGTSVVAMSRGNWM